MYVTINTKECSSKHHIYNELQISGDSSLTLSIVGISKDLGQNNLLPVPDLLRIPPLSRKGLTKQTLKVISQQIDLAHLQVYKHLNYTSCTYLDAARGYLYYTLNPACKSKYLRFHLLYIPIAQFEGSWNKKGHIIKPLSPTQRHFQ